MDSIVHNRIVSFIWSIADDVLRDIFVRGKYRDIILPFTVLRRLDALLVPTKDAVIEQVKFLDDNGIYDHDSLRSVTKYPFWNESIFTFDKLLDNADDIDSNLIAYLDGFSPNVQEIITRFKLRSQLETLKENNITHLLVEKFASREINLSPQPALNSKGEELPGLSNLEMGYVFEELIRKFNEDNNEEAGEHFTPREIIKLMTQLLFIPVKDKMSSGSYLLYDPACGSGGMLTEAEELAKSITENKATFHLYGQEINPETYAICTSDMLIKGENADKIAYGSTLSKDAFSDLKFDFMLTNPPYGKSWKLDENAIVDNRGKKGTGDKSENIKDHRFQVGLPTISDGQLLFMLNMISKMKHNSDFGSRIASVHNGSALFTGDAGGGESEIRKHIIANDYLECIIALPKNIFYNTGIPTYVWILSNRKTPERKGKVQLIDASEMYVKLRKNLGQKNCELNKEHIDEITQIYTDFKETEISKIFPNEYFGYKKITIERPLRKSAQFTEEALKPLRYGKSNHDLMANIYDEIGEEIYKDFDSAKPKIEKYLKSNKLKLKAKEKAELLDGLFWKNSYSTYLEAKRLMKLIGTEQFDDYNKFWPLLTSTVKEHKLNIDSRTLTRLDDLITWRNEDAEPIVYKKDKKGNITYIPDSDLRDTESVPLTEDVQTYFEREVLQYVPDAWIDHSKTVEGYEISFTRYFYNYVPPRSIEEITAEILQLESETDGILKQIVNS